MKLNEILEENINRKISVIRRECSNVVSAYSSLGGERLYHGVQGGMLGPLKKIKIRTNRTPLDTSVEKTLIFNLAIERMYGIERVRNISKFVTPDRDLTGGFGETTVAYLPNNAKMLFNPNVHDSIGIMNSVPFGMQTRQLVPKIVAEIGSPVRTIKTLKDIKNHTKQSFYDTIIETLDEIVSREFSDYRVELATEQNIKKLLKYATYPEIMVFGTSHFWAVTTEADDQLLDGQ